MPPPKFKEGDTVLIARAVPTWDAWVHPTMTNLVGRRARVLYRAIYKGAYEYNLEVLPEANPDNPENNYIWPEAALEPAPYPARPRLE